MRPLETIGIAGAPNFHASASGHEGAPGGIPPKAPDTYIDAAPSTNSGTGSGADSGVGSSSGGNASPPGAEHPPILDEDEEPVIVPPAPPASSLAQTGGEAGQPLTTPHPKEEAEEIKPPSPGGNDRSKALPQDGTNRTGPTPVAYSTDATRPLVSGKLKLKTNQYPPDDVRAYVDQNYRCEAYADMLGSQPNPDNVFLVSPSTSGSNTVPVELANRLQKDFGGQVMSEGQHGIASTSAEESKARRGFAAKMESPTTMEMRDPTLPSKLAGKRVYLVDDIMTSGDTTDILERQLQGLGVPIQGVTVLGAARGGEPASISQLNELSSVLSRSTGENLAAVKADVNIALGRNRATMVINALKEAQNDPKGIRALIRSRANAFRASLGGGAQAH